MPAINMKLINVYTLLYKHDRRLTLLCPALPYPGATSTDFAHPTHRFNVFLMFATKSE